MPGPGSQPYSKLDQLGGQSRRERKQARLTEEDRQERQCYALVNARDERICRVCRARTSAQGGLLHRTVHHHLIYRSGISVSAGRHASWNVVTICPACNEDIHSHGTLRLEGDADACDAVTGKLAGVQVSRYTESGWVVEKFV